MALDDPHPRPSESPRADGPRASPTVADPPPFAGDEVLPCGRLLSRVREQAQDLAPAADAHTVSCPRSASTYRPGRSSVRSAWAAAFTVASPLGGLAAV
jgi:hypothetical protein